MTPMGQTHSSIKLLNDDQHVTNAALLNSLADAYRGATHYKRELRLLEAATEKINPQNMWLLQEVYKKLGAAYARIGEKEKAKRTLRKMGAIHILLGGGSNWAKLHLVTLYRQYDMSDDAKAIYMEIFNDLSADPNLRQIAQMHLMGGDTNEIGNFRVQRIVAQQHTHKGEYGKAVELYKQIIAEKP